MTVNYHIKTRNLPYKGTHLILIYALIVHTSRIQAGMDQSHYHIRFLLITQYRHPIPGCLNQVSYLNFTNVVPRECILGHRSGHT